VWNSEAVWRRCSLQLFHRTSPGPFGDGDQPGPENGIHPPMTSTLDVPGKHNRKLSALPAGVPDLALAHPGDGHDAWAFQAHRTAAELVACGGADAGEVRLRFVQQAAGQPDGHTESGEVHLVVGADVAQQHLAGLYCDAAMNESEAQHRTRAVESFHGGDK